MSSSGILRRVALVRTDFSEECSSSVVRVTRIGDIGTALAVTSNRNTMPGNTSVRRSLVTDNVPSSPMLVALMMGGGGYVSQKYRFLQDLYSAISQKAAFFISLSLP
jgi:hypothetical protein